MGEKTFKIIAVIAVAAAIASLGWLAFDQFFIPVVNPSRQYYDVDYSTRAIPSSSAWSTYTGLSVIFTLNAGETVYMSYTAYADIQFTTPASSLINFNFRLDGIRLSNPAITVGRYSDPAPNGIYIPVCLQHFNSSISAGLHTLTVTFQGTNSSDTVQQQTLFVQVFS